MKTKPHIFLLLFCMFILLFPVRTYAITQGEASALPVRQFSAQFGDSVSYAKIDAWYHFRISERGKVRFHTQWDHNGVYMDFCRHDDLTGKIARWSGSELRDSNSTSWFGLEGGDYYLHVYSFSEQTASYQVSIEFQANSTWEQENFNDTQSYAMTSGTLYYGTLHNDKDVDIYQVNMEKDGYFTFDFSPDANDCDMSKIGTGWNVDLINPVTQKSVLGGTYNMGFSSYKFPFKKGQYNIKISYNAGGSTAGQAYNIKTNITYVDNWEKEDNNNGENTANILTPDVAVYGNSTGWEWDLDVYKFTLAKDADVILSFKKTDAADTALINDGWDVGIYDGYDFNGKAKLITNQGKVTDSASLKASLSKGTYYVWVSADDWGYRSGRPEGVDYEIKLSVQNKELGKVTIKKAKSSGKKVQLSWNKDAGAEGYEVHRSIKKKSGFKKVADVKKTSYKDKKVKKKKTYYYKIRAYATSNGKKKYGKWSKTVKVKVK